jgi:hypothetical protein
VPSLPGQVLNLANNNSVSEKKQIKEKIIRRFDMAVSKSANVQNQEGREQMTNRNQNVEKLLSRVGWGLFLVLVGALIFANNKGWVKAEGWLYFTIGMGCIFVVSFLVRYFAGHDNLWNAFGGLVAGLALIYTGISFLFGFGDWWPMALVIIGTGYLAKAFLHHNSESYSN